MYIGIPITTKDGQIFTKRGARYIAADAFNNGALAFALEIGFYSETVIRRMTDSAIERLFRANVMFCLNATIKAGGYVSATKFGLSTITTPAVWGPE